MDLCLKKSQRILKLVFNLNLSTLRRIEHPLHLFLVLLVLCNEVAQFCLFYAFLLNQRPTVQQHISQHRNLLIFLGADVCVCFHLRLHLHQSVGVVVDLESLQRCQVQKAADFVFHLSGLGLGLLDG